MPCCMLPRHKGLCPLKPCVRNKPVLCFLKLLPHVPQQWVASCLPPPSHLEEAVTCGTSKGSGEKHIDLRWAPMEAPDPRAHPGLWTPTDRQGRRRLPLSTALSTPPVPRSSDCTDACDPYRILQAPRTLFSTGVSAVIWLGLTSVTGLEHRGAGLQLISAGWCSILSLRAQSIQGRSDPGPWQIPRRGAGWAGLLTSHSVAPMLASFQTDSSSLGPSGLLWRWGMRGSSL